MKNFFSLSSNLLLQTLDPSPIRFESHTEKKTFFKCGKLTKVLSKLKLFKYFTTLWILFIKK